MLPAPHSATLYVVGDALAQKLDGTLDRSGYDVTRARTALIWGGVLFAPAAHVWYNRVLNPLFPGAGTKAVAAKMLLDQTIWALPCNMAYLSVSNLLSGKSAEQSTQIAKNQIVDVMKSVSLSLSLSLSRSRSLSHTPSGTCTHKLNEIQRESSV